jgi:glycolate oxidase FAD binding subunit
VSSAAPDVARRLADLAPPEALFSARLPDGSERPAVAPPDAAGVASVLGWAAREGWAVLVSGAGSRLGERNRGGRIDLVLSTRALTGVVAYEPGDGTLTARAGARWAELAATVAGGGHHLAPDIPRAAQTSLGGVVASGAGGLDRLRYGPVRHQVLGTRVALADGSLAKSGGALVKNVTGYDLHRLFSGSWGTLCVILEVSLRLHPLPEREAVVAARFAQRAPALAAARAVGELPVKPCAVVVHRPQELFELVVLLAGRFDAVESEARAIAERVPATRLFEGERAQGIRRFLRDRPVQAAGRPTLELALLPSLLEPALDRIERAAAELGIELALVLHPLLATVEIDLARADELERPTLLAFQRALVAAGVRIHWRAAPRALVAGPEPFDVFGPPAALPWMKRLRDALDPQGVFARGGFAGGL